MTSAQPKPPKRSSADSLEERLSEHIAELSDMHLAYRALERLVSPEYGDEEHDKVPVSRAEMGALLHVLNAEMRRRLDAFERTARAIRAQQDGDEG